LSLDDLIHRREKGFLEGECMTDNSTKSQSSEATQSFSDAAAKMVDSLTKAIKDLPTWAQFGAFFLVVALVASAITTLSMSSDEAKKVVILSFFIIFSVFVVFLYAFSARQTKIESHSINLKKAAYELQTETDKRINGLESIRNQLQGIESQLIKLPSSEDTEILKRKIVDILKAISEDLEMVDSYRKKIAAANYIESRTKNSDIYAQLAAKYSGKQPK